MLEIKGLTVGYGDGPILKDVSLTIPPGQITAILGPNGCGKSTLLKALCGILTPEAGDIVLDGRSILDLPPRIAAQSISYLAQSRQVPDITVRRMVLHGRFPYLSFPRRYRPADMEAAQRAMEELDLTALGEVPLSRLSGGQRQKVYVAMALAQDTQVVLLDEPTTFLDVAHQLQMMALARRLSRQGKSVVMVLHDIPQALSKADRLVLLRSGQVAGQGEPEALFTSGLLDEVFGVELHRTRTDRGWIYYYEEAET